MRSAILLLPAILALSTQASDAPYPYEGHAERPVAPMQLHGTCPGECCSYGDWRTTGTTTLHAEARDAARLLARVPAGTELVALGGFVHLTRVGAARSMREVSLGWNDKTAAHSMLPAHVQVSVLDHLGEGFWRVWHAGEIHQLPVDDSAADAVGQDSDPQRGLVFEHRPVSTWWAQVRLPRADQAGWINMDEAPLITGADGCAD